jgi:hypothetical protein
MSQLARKTLCLRAIVFAAVAMAAGNAVLADDNPPPSNPPAGGRHNNPAWAACKKQADDQKIQPGDAHRQFMKTCLKSAKSSGTAPPG